MKLEESFLVEEKVSNAFSQQSCESAESGALAMGDHNPVTFAWWLPAETLRQCLDPDPKKL